MKSTRTLCIALSLALVLALAGCGKKAEPSSNAPESPSDSPSPSVSVSETPSATPSTTPDASPAATAENEYMQMMVDQLRADFEPLNAQMKGLCAFEVEAEGNETLALIVTIEDESISDTDSCEEMTDGISPLLISVLPAMQMFELEDPKIVIRFNDVDGAPIYSREFTLDDVVEDTDRPAFDPALATGEPSDILVEYVKTQQSSAEVMEESLAGLVDVTVEGRGLGTIVYCFYIKEFSVSAGLTAESIENEALPMFESQFVTLLPVMAAAGLENPCITVEFYNPDGTLLASSDIY